jgi:hypothetical protein
MSTIITANRISNYMGYAPLPAKMGLGSLLVQNLPNSKEVCRNMVCSLLLRGRLQAGSLRERGKGRVRDAGPCSRHQEPDQSQGQSHYRKTLGCCHVWGGHGRGGQGRSCGSVRGCVCDAGPLCTMSLRSRGKQSHCKTFGMLSRLGGHGRAAGTLDSVRCHVGAAYSARTARGGELAGMQRKKKKCDKCFASCALRFSTVCFARTRLIKEARPVSSPLHRTNIHSVRDTSFEAWG